MAKTKTEASSFEESLKRIEALVIAMETGEVPLKDLVKHYEEGASLLTACQKELTEASLRVEKVINDSHLAPMVEPFEEE